ncbi:erythromycin esterase family protein [Nocardiopsis sp. FIRDI 009]|uniref:erythromycin esterase family protein n=1 Tax=Nocardiopsis sp. FIRDI 009 TaxID=714197 RepID=UPI000E248BE3|nr:erythromycin esterase family protein [Nocardiopsis sp. FIRDI 009]
MSVALAVRSAGACFSRGGAGLGEAVDAFLDSRPRPPRLLGLGEPTHGVEVFAGSRNRLLRHLVRVWGYRSVALESDCLAGLAVDDHVTSGVGDVEEVMAVGFSHGFGELAANRELVEWLRAYNAGRAEADQVRFYGFDAPVEITAASSPREALSGLHGYLTEHVGAERVPHAWARIDELVGEDGAWTEPEAMFDPRRSVGASARARELRVVTDDLVGVLSAEAPGLVAATSVRELERARLYARTARGLLRYHAVMACAEEGRGARMARLVAARDAMMADHLRAVVRGERGRGPSLVFAHNQHLRRDRGGMTMGGEELTWWSAGAVAATDLGGEYAVIAADAGSVPGLGVAGADTFQGVLREAAGEGALWRADRLASALAGAPVARRADSDHTYFPLDPEDLGGVDGVFFVGEAAPGSG